MRTYRRFMATDEDEKITGILDHKKMAVAMEKYSSVEMLPA